VKTDATQDKINARLHQHYTERFVGDGAKTEFLLTHTYGRPDDVCVFVNGNRMRPQDRATAHDFKVRGITAGYDGDRNAIKFTVAPVLNADVCVDVIST
jgi:hypothetical protein